MTPPSTAEMDDEHVPLTASQKGQDEGNSPKAGSSSNRVAEGDEQVAVCRICLEEDTCSNLEAPCSCSGTMKHAHHSCLQRWCNEKGDLTCEICKQPFRGDFEEPPPPPPRSQHVTVWGQEYLIVADPETGTIRAHRLQELFDEEDAEEEATRLQTGTAWWFTAILLALCLLLVRHLFSLFSSAGVPSGGAGTGHAAGEGAGSSSGGGSGGAAGGSQGQAPHHHGDEADSAFEDLSMTLLILWLLVRMLVMIAPFYTVWGGAAAWARGRAANWQSEQRERAQHGDRDTQSEPDAVAEIELEQRLDRIIQRMEAGGADTDSENREDGPAHQGDRLGQRQEGQRQEGQRHEGQQEEEQPQQEQHAVTGRT